MSQEKRKQLGQIVFLVILLAGLGFSVFHMINTVNRQSTGARSRRAQTAQRKEAPVATPAPAEAGAAVTQTPAAEQAPGAEAGAAPLEIPDNIEMNLNLFKVYQFDPPKNPFVQQEEWYTEELEQVPGYPTLRDIDYFETMTPVIPELDNLLDEDEAWQEARLTKTEVDTAYTFSGLSEDGQINTRLTMTGPEGRETDINWRPGTGIPLSALSDPNWQQHVNLPADDGMPSTMPSADDLFQSPDGGLQIPGLEDVLTGGVVPSDQLYCHGVSGLDIRATALVSYNGTTRLIGVGDGLPPRYQVEAITPDGVVLNNLRTGEAMWLPISAPLAMTGGGGGSSTADMPVPVPVVPADSDTRRSTSARTSS